jgi:plasmid stabilization system protein ParE
MVMRVEWSEQAEKDVKTIFDYLKSVAGERTARKMVSKIYSSSILLAGNPLAGQREFSLGDMPHEYRRLIEGNYKLIYRTVGEAVDVVAVWDARRDPVALRKRVGKNAD